MQTKRAGMLTVNTQSPLSLEIELRRTHNIMKHISFQDEFCNESLFLVDDLLK